MMTLATSMRRTFGLMLLLISQLILSNLAFSAPSIATITTQTSNEGEAVAIQASGSTDVTGATISYSATGLPAGISITPSTGRIAGTLSYTTSGDYTVTVTVTESGSLLTASTTFGWHINDVNRPPFTVPQPPITMNEGTRLTTVILFADYDNDILTTTSIQLPPFARVTGTTSQPGGLNISLEATPGFSDAGVYSIVISATDGKSAPITNTVSLTVVNVNQPPQITNPGPQTYPAGTRVSLQIVATDADLDVLAYSAVNLPAGLSISPTTGLISGTIALFADPTYSSAIAVADAATQTQITVNWTITTAAPVVSILSPGDQTSNEGDAITLPVAASSTDGGTLMYSATGLPAGLAIDSAGIISGSLGYDTMGDYAVTITATLQSDATKSAETSFNWHVNNTNRPPVANAGPDQNVITLESTTVDGSASSDPDGQMLTFVWHVVSVPAGSSISDTSLSGGTTPQATFTPDVDGVYTLDLEVSDGSLTAIDSVLVMATTPPNVPPNANAGVDQNAEINTTVLLDGSASNDPDGYPQVLSYRWFFSAVPAGSALTDANIVNATAEQASFVPDVTGVYVISLEVSDGLAQATDQMQVTATYTNVAPVANAGVDQTVALGTQVQLNGTSSHDPDQYPDALTYSWSVSSVPTGSAITNAAISSADTANASFIPDVAGTYLIRLDVSDGEASAFDQMTVTVQPIGLAPTTPEWINLRQNRRGIYLIWKEVSGAENYNVYRKTAADADFVLIKQTNDHRIKDELPYGTYAAEYYVTAVNQYGASEPSVTVSTEHRPSYRRKKKDD